MAHRTGWVCDTLATPNFPATSAGHKNSDDTKKNNTDHLLIQLSVSRAMLRNTPVSLPPVHEVIRETCSVRPVPGTWGFVHLTRSSQPWTRQVPLPRAHSQTGTERQRTPATVADPTTRKRDLPGFAFQNPPPLSDTWISASAYGSRFCFPRQCASGAPCFSRAPPHDRRKEQLSLMGGGGRGTGFLPRHLQVPVSASVTQA